MFINLREESSFQFGLAFNFCCPIFNSVKDTMKGSHVQAGSFKPGVRALVFYVWAFDSE